ncbi:unnamed protein product, partial [Porites lobata]
QKNDEDKDKEEVATRLKMAEKQKNDEDKDKEEVATSEDDVTETAQDLQAAPDPGYRHEEQYTDGGRLVRQCTEPGGGHNPICGSLCLRRPTEAHQNVRGPSVPESVYLFKGEGLGSAPKYTSFHWSQLLNEEMDTNSDSGSSPTNQPVVPFALGQGSNAANQAIRQQNDHQANQARYGLPNMIAGSSHAQPQVYMESSISFSKQKQRR